MSNLDGTTQAKAIRAREQLPEGFSFFRIQVVDAGSRLLGFKLTGGIPTTYKRGPRKGQPKWDLATAMEYGISVDEVKAYMARTT